MNRRRTALAAVLFGGVALAAPSPARAELEGGCSASGQWREAGLSVDAEAVGDDVVTIPRSDTVDWQGSFTGPPGEHSGSIWLELPPPFGKVEIDNWGGEGETTSNSGSEEYDLPKFVPAGVEFRVAGEHKDENGTCTGHVNMKIKGGITDSPIFYAFAVLTIVFGALLGFALIPVFQAMIKAGIKGA
jgi:hypothetical protein